MELCELLVSVIFMILLRLKAELLLLRMKLVNAKIAGERY